MSLNVRHVLLLVAVAILAAVVVLLLVRPPVAAPTAVDPSASPPSVIHGNPIPAADPVPWSAADWRAMEDPFAPHRPPLLRIDGLTDAGELLIGWGRTPAQGRNQFNDMGAVFLSRDGRSWHALPVDHAVNAASASELTGVATGPLGFLAYGSVCCEPELRAMWHSSEGTEWTRLEIGGDLDPSDIYFNAAVGTADGWVVVGNRQDGSSGEIWASHDGVTWDSVLVQEAGLPGLTLSDVAVTPGGLIAVGTVSGPDGTYDGAIWTSPDGRVWKRVGVDDLALAGAGEAQLRHVVPYSGGIYVVGSYGSTEDRERCEQLGMATPLGAGPPGTAISCGWGTDHQWISADGAGWRRINPADAAGEFPIEFRVVVAGGPGLLVLGESSAAGSPDTRLFASTDGVLWTAVDPARPIGIGVAKGLVARGRHLVAVADHFDGTRSELLIWLGTVR